MISRNSRKACSPTQNRFAVAQCSSGSRFRFLSSASFEVILPDRAGTNTRNPVPSAESIYLPASNKPHSCPNQSSPRRPKRNPVTTKIFRGQDVARSSDLRLRPPCGIAVSRFIDEGSSHAASRGIIIADTKFEFGLHNNEILLIDECLTPDSSRFWPADSYEVGASPFSFDKQFVRDYLETLDWDKTPPAPPLPPEIIEKTARKYQEAFTLLAG